MEQWLINNLGSDASQLNGWVRLGIVAGIVVAAYLVDLIFTKAIIPLIQRMAKRTSTQWDDILLSPRVCKAFSHVLPPIILATAVPFVTQGTFEVILTRLLYIYIIYNVSYFVTVLLHAIFNLFIHEKQQKASSLQGILQTLQIIVWIVAIIVIISTLMDRSPLYLITGLGAAATVLMLIFQDSIKGLVAGVQLSMNDMVRVDDWIAMPSRGVDGTVFQITLTAVKVRNWDNTILTIPPYSLLTETFQNWRGMSESGGRRIARAINVNMLSVQTLDAHQAEEYRQKGWLPSTSSTGLPTNLEAYRGFVLQHLRRHPGLNQQMTMMVRQLPPSSEGVPVQVYAFTRTKEWLPHEEIQAQIIEFMLATMSQFGILPYQRSSDKPL